MLAVTLQFILAMVAHAFNEPMARSVEYLQEEVSVLRQALTTATGKSRVLFTPEQRRRLAIKGQALTPNEREACCQLVRPATILAWFRHLAAKKYDGSKSRKAVRPRKASDIRALVLELARNNPGWGYTKIRDALRGLKIEIGRTTVANMLEEAGIEPAPERGRKRTRKQFLGSHWETLYACDFFAVETLGGFGTVRRMVFFVIELKSRAVQIAGIRIAPDGAWMAQVARNLLDPLDGFLRNATYLIHDRDPLFTRAWTELLRSSGVTTVPIPAQSPNCNCYAERFVRTIRAECLAHFVIFGERHLRYLVHQFVEHYQTERYHQGVRTPSAPSSTCAVSTPSGQGQSPGSLPRERPAPAEPAAPVAEALGISVYAKQCVDGRDRRQLERLCRYITRPPLALERLSRRADGRLELELKSVWKDGTRAVVLEPDDLLLRLCAAVPAPRLHLLRYFGILSSHHALRSEVTPRTAPEPGLFTPPPALGDQQVLPLDSPDAEAPRSGRARWAWLIGHVFRADVEHCSRCGGPMRWVEAATTPEAISRLLAKHGLAPRPPPPSRSPPSSHGQLSFGFAGSAR